MLISHCPEHHRMEASTTARGFTLIEMMVSIVIGMLVALGAVSLIVAIDRANSETIRASRLDQEMRALASVIGDEVKRARRLHDPLFFVGQGGTNSGVFDLVDTSTAGCIVYGYQDATLNDDLSASSPKEGVNNFEAIYLDSGAVFFARLSETCTSSTAATCTTTTNGPLACASATNTGKGATVTQLNSAQLNVTSLIFKCVTSNGTTVSDVANTTAADTALVQQTCNQIDLTLSATLSSGDAIDKKNPITHTYVQQIFIRSGAAKTS